MDKKRLNQEIILCRPIVKKARVYVVRKLLKQIKLLRSCKNEAMKEKKFRKAKRLVAEIHVMKLLRPDYVTKFALLTENYVSTGSNTKLKRKRNVCAKIAKNKDLVSKVNAIRNKFINWREELPLLLKSAKKKVEEEEEKPSEVDGNNVQVSKETDKSSDENGSENEEEISGSEDDEEEEESEQEMVEDEEIEIPKPKTMKPPEVPKASNAKTKKKRKSPRKAEEEEESDEEMVEDDEEIKIPKPKTMKPPEVPKAKNAKTKKKKGSPVKAEEENDQEEAEEKIEDPFFIGKKITVPKLLQKVSENHPENEKVRKRQLSDDMEEEFRARKKRNANDESKRMKELRREVPTRRQPLTEDELHPSWKAKKQQTIKPFQGKKIIFE